jgi:excisionase family DNA binding protein
LPNRLRWRVYADTNALYPIGIADLLLRLADDKVTELLWTDYLLDEVERVLVDKKGLPRTAAQYFCQCIRDTFPQGHIPEADYRDLIDSRTGPDADDHPHSAAAITGRADVLLSADSKGFPPNDVHPAIRMSPDEFFTVNRSDPAQKARTLSVEEAAGLLGISRSTAYECVKSGELPSLRFRRASSYRGMSSSGF